MAVVVEDLRLISVREVAETLNVDKLTVYKMVKAGELPAVRVRRAVRIPVSALAKLPRYGDTVPPLEGDEAD